MLAGHKRRSYAGTQHPFPSPHRLKPEWVAPRKSPVLHHTLVTAPNAVYQDVDAASLMTHFRERLSDGPIVSMVTRQPPYAWRQAGVGH